MVSKRKRRVSKKDAEILNQTLTESSALVNSRIAQMVTALNPLFAEMDGFRQWLESEHLPPDVLEALEVCLADVGQLDPPDYDDLSWGELRYRIEKIVGRRKWIERRSQKAAGNQNSPIDDLVTIKDVAELLENVSWKTLQNTDSKKWGLPDGKVNGSRAWSLSRIRPIILETRRFKQS